MTTRLISAGIGVVIALTVLFLHQTFLFPLCVGIVSLIILLEFYRVNDLFYYRSGCIAGLAYALGLPMLTVGPAARYRLLLTVVCVTVILCDFIYHRTKMQSRSFFALIAGMFLIPTALSTIVILNHSHEQHGIIYVVLALGGAWIADSGAYFVGSLCGRHKLCPSISPHKTIEGFLGGILANVLFFVLFNVIYAAIIKQRGVVINYHWLSTVLLAMVCAVLGTLGDLSASVLKRQLGIKDYGTIMPGHGGLLDRFDSVLLVLPFFCAYVSSIGYYTT